MVQSESFRLRVLESFFFWHIDESDTCHVVGGRLRVHHRRHLHQTERLIQSAAAKICSKYTQHEGEGIVEFYSSMNPTRDTHYRQSLGWVVVVRKRC